MFPGSEAGRLYRAPPGEKHVEGRSKTAYRIALEECIRCMALEVVIGLPPIGITEALGGDVHAIEATASVSLAIPVAIGFFIFFRRLAGNEPAAQEPHPWPVTRRQGVHLTVASAFAIGYALWLSSKGLFSLKETLVAVFWTVLTLLWVFRKRPPAR